MPWWMNEPLRVVEICDGLDFNGISLQKQADIVADLGGNVQHFHCMFHGASDGDTAGLNDRRLYFNSSLARKRNPDRLGKYLPMARKKGIRVLPYFNVHWYTWQFGEEHPDWRQVRENQTPIDQVYSTGTSFCVNALGYRDWVFQILRDLARYDIDGVFYDGPIFFSDSCYCPECRRLFRERTGQDLPPKSNRDHPLWKELVEFQADSIARFLADSDAILKAINPELLFYMNGNANWPYWPTGRDNVRIIRHSDMLIAEGGFLYNDLNHQPLHKPGVTAKLLSSQSGGKPALGANAAGHKPWNWYLLPEPEISLLFAQTLAHGGTYWTAFFPGNLNQPQLNVIRDYNRLIQRHPQAFAATRSLARVALLWPDHGCNFYRGSSVPLTDFTRKIDASGAGDLAAEFQGFYDALTAAQVPFDVIGEDNLADPTAYDLIFLPNAPSLADDAAEALRRFVAKGGNLVATFETSLYQRDGRRRDDFGLADLFGVRYDGEIFGPMNWDYLTRTPSRKNPYRPATSSNFIPAPVHGIRVAATTGRALMNFCHRLPGCYENTPTVSELPFLVENRHGRGRTVFLAGTLGAALSAARFPDHTDLIATLADRLATPLVKIDDAPWIEVGIRSREGKTWLHLINYMAGLKRPIRQLRRRRDVQLWLRSAAARATLLRQGKKLPVRKRSNGICLTVPQVEDYEIIELS